MGQNSPMTEPTLETARNVAEATLAHASHLGIKVSVCVVDSRGHELVTLRADGANWFTAEVARAKARTAAALRRDSGALDGLKGSYPELFRLIGGQLPFEPTTLPGGVVHTGETAWAVGVSGATPEQDVACARAGLSAA